MAKNGISKIAFVNFSTTWGGGEAQHLALAKETIRQGQKAIIITSLGSLLSVKARDARIPTIDLKVSKLSFLNPLLHYKIRTLLSEIEPEAIILNASLELKHFAISTSKLKHTLIYRRGFFANIKVSQLNRFLFSRLSSIVAVSDYVKNHSLKQIAPYSPSIQTIYNGIEPNKITALPKYRNKRLVAIGRLDSVKQFDLLIRAMPEVLKHIPDASLWIIGGGALKAELAQLINELKLQKHITLKGFRNDVPELLSHCSLLVHPAKYEAFGVTFLEAMRQNLPCISFRGHAGDELILHNNTGLLVSNQNAKELSDSIVSVLNKPKQLETMGKAAYDRFTDHYTIQECVNNYLKLIDKISCKSQ